ncbi:hypothetical protein SAMN05421688_2105 [Poseidonocella pacifica]|uniref:Uncharacterized protein n=1 Tax=Poseidonocella pacifica TaxID=871651 RepID=A0A1I0XDH1_9RHOB|nr:hypothetical protein [Poseidonocella pacifica]SFA98476.1 hypothetical protein SAMN05421688_2105 [Poseidonocella pacifica]
MKYLVPLFLAAPAYAHQTEALHAHPHSMDAVPVLLGITLIASAGALALARVRAR